METGTAVIKGKEMLSIQECWRGRHFEQHVKLRLRTPASHVRMPGTGATSASHPVSWRQQRMAQVLGSLPLIWDTWFEHLTPG